MHIRRIKEILMRHSLFPDAVQIEVSTKCNASCPACWINGIKRPRMIMDASLYKKIITECSVYKPGIELSWVGEPTLDPDIVSKIKFAKESGIRYVALYTNGSLMDEPLSRQIIESGLDCIMFSVDGITRHTYEMMRRGLDFDTVMRNINNFIKLRNSSRRKCLKININFLKTRFNIDEYEGFVKEWKTRVDNIFSWPLTENFDEYAASDDRQRCYSRRQPCFYLWRHLPIYVDGRTGLCCCFAKEEVITGDVSKGPIKDAWNSEVFNRYRSMHSKARFNELKLCDRCNFWKFPVY